jgi:hypothetical protein
VCRDEFGVELSPAERTELEAASRRYSAPYRDVIRARIVLLAAEGQENIEIAHQLDTPVQIVVAEALLRGGPRWPGGALANRPSAGFSPQNSSSRSRRSRVSCRPASACPSAGSTFPISGPR